MNDRFDGDGDALVELGLVAYARAALTPDPDAMARIRTAIRREAQIAIVRRRADERRIELAAIETARIRGERARWRRPFAGWTAGRVGVVLSGAVLAGLVLAGTAFAGSRAGGPLYDARVWFEELNLPADPAARLVAEIARAQTRLAEATQAEASGDSRALEAALGKYAEIVDETLDDHTEGADGAEQASLAFQHHKGVLTAIQAQLEEGGSPAADAVLHALEQSSAAIDVLGGAAAGEAPAAGGASGPANEPGAGAPGRPEDPGAGAGAGGADNGNGAGQGGHGGQGAGQGSGQQGGQASPPANGPDGQGAGAPGRGGASSGSDTDGPGGGSTGPAPASSGG